MIFQQIRRRVMAVACAACVGIALPAAADAQNERTELKFSEAVKIPGMTLDPGTYVFRLADLSSDRHLVQVMNEDETQLITTIPAVPAQRQDAVGDTVLKFNPSAGGTPALKAWFYPGTVFGHEFVYPDAEARDIARRTKTIVLSTEVPASEMQKGAIHVYDAAGVRTPWTPDTATAAAWTKWHQDRAARATAAVAKPGAKNERAHAPMVAADPRGVEVAIGELEERSDQYIGKVVSVDAEVETVLGPRMFTIDEPGWGDLDGEVMVYMPTGLAALVREGDRVTVTGTPKAYVRADFEREWGWFEPEPDVEMELNERAVLVANRIVGGNNNMALVIKSAPATDTTPAPVGTSGTTKMPESTKVPESTKAPDTTGTAASAAALNSLEDIASDDEDIVGRHVSLDKVAVTATAKDGGFWVRGPAGTSVFVLPSDRSATFSNGQQVSLDGVVLQMPRAMDDRLDPGVGWNDDIYIYATAVTR